ncbi:MAG: hypothetical protein IJF01_07445 [Tidjanibacter sp.]|nr:hypothetical protein [Tidjanibacter sp.]
MVTIKRKDDLQRTLLFAGPKATILDFLKQAPGWHTLLQLNRVAGTSDAAKSIARLRCQGWPIEHRWVENPSTQRKVKEYRLNLEAAYTKGDNRWLLATIHEIIPFDSKAEMMAYVERFGLQLRTKV